MAFDWGLLGGLFSSVTGLIDDLHTSEEEKMQAKAAIFSVQSQIYSQVLQYETSLLKAKSDVIQSEAAGDSWIQRSWRPITMLVLLGLVVADLFGLTANSIDGELRKEFFTLIQIGLGGYVVGRSGEKIVKSLDLGNRKSKDV